MHDSADLLNAWADQGTLCDSCILGISPSISTSCPQFFICILYVLPALCLMLVCRSANYECHRRWGRMLFPGSNHLDLTQIGQFRTTGIELKGSGVIKPEWPSPAVRWTTLNTAKTSPLQFHAIQIISPRSINILYILFYSFSSCSCHRPHDNNSDVHAPQP